MTGSLIVVALGAVAAAAGTGVLTARCARTPRLFLVAWTVAMFALAVALAAQALGYLSGFSDIVFRAMEIGAQAVAPLALCLGLVELTGRSIVSRFAMRLAVAAIGVVVLVILGSDPLSPNITLGTTWPDPAVVYQLVPVGLIKFLAVFTLLIALGSALTAGARSRRGPEYEVVTRPVLIAAAAAVMVALAGAAMLAGSSLGSTGSALAQLAAVALTWYAAVLAGRAGLVDEPRPVARDEDSWARSRDLIASYGDHDGYDDPAGVGHAGAYREDGYPAGGYADDHYGDDGYRDDRYRDDDYRDDAPAVPDTGIGNPALAALAAEPDGPGGRRDADRMAARDFDSEVYTGKIDKYYDGPDGSDGLQSASQGPLFGQITIYTVLDECIDDFDRMSERVVEQVRANEPGTLVYIAHAVPTAPMQRILYEVYKDRASYDDHLLQPYVARFEAQRRAMVLATNAIELGLQQAKVSPLPSYSAISDILSESGIDLTGVTRSGQQGAPGTGSSASYARSGPRELPPPDSGGHYPDEPEYDRWTSREDGRY